jgi:hypothetical protein
MKSWLPFTKCRLNMSCASYLQIYKFIFRRLMPVIASIHSSTDLWRPRIFFTNSWQCFSYDASVFEESWPLFFYSTFYQTPLARLIGKKKKGNFLCVSKFSLKVDSNFDLSASCIQNLQLRTAIWCTLWCILQPETKIMTCPVNEYLDKSEALFILPAKPLVITNYSLLTLRLYANVTVEFMELERYKLELKS